MYFITFFNFNMLISFFFISTPISVARRVTSRHRAVHLGAPCVVHPLLSPLHHKSPCHHLQHCQLPRPVCQSSTLATCPSLVNSTTQSHPTLPTRFHLLRATMVSITRLSFHLRYLREQPPPSHWPRESLPCSPSHPHRHPCPLRPLRIRCFPRRRPRGRGTRPLASDW